MKINTNRKGMLGVEEWEGTPPEDKKNNMLLLGSVHSAVLHKVKDAASATSLPRVCEQR